MDARRSKMTRTDLFYSELAMQTSKYVRDLAKFTDLSHCLLLGGDSMESQFEALANNPDIIIATPGRLAHIAKVSCIEHYHIIC